MTLESGSATEPSVSNATVVDGYPATTITLKNDLATAVLTDMGARLLELHVADRQGKFADVVLGRPTLTEALHDPNYMGSTAGRFANRIRDGRFTLGDKAYQVSVNEGTNHLHGGLRGFDRYGWSTALDEDGAGVRFSRISPDGEEGFPGEVTARVHYRLEGATLLIAMTATTNQLTVVNMVHHSYFNLGGHQSGSVLDHQVQIDAEHYTPVDDMLLPTGEIAPVAGTPFDFTTPKAVRTDQDAVQHSGAGRVSDGGGGYDHNWVLNGTGMRQAATVSDPASGRLLTLSTDQPGLHLYTGGYLKGVSAKAPLATYPAFAGLTLETQTFPDGINHPNFPQPTLAPDEVYRNRVRLAFTTV